MLFIIYYSLQFSFCSQNYSTSYALIHLTETIKEALDQGKYGHEIFDFQKAFGTVDHNFLLGQLKHYGIRGAAYSSFQSFILFFILFNWDSLHARLNSHYEAWSYKKRSIIKITGYRKSV